MMLLYVAIGGALGSVARFLMQSFVGQVAGNEFPYGTLLVNISGSLLMGVFIGWLARTTPANAPDLRMFVAVGILGGYTTFSSFSLDAITLMEQGKWVSMGVYILASVIVSLLGLIAGLQFIRSFA
jgi:fluoride exporter